MSGLTLVAFLTDDYDRAIDWFTTALGWRVLEDTRIGPKRWVRIGCAGGAALLIARATGPQAEAIGKQFGGRVGFFWEVADFDTVAARMRRHGVAFEEPPRDEPYGRVAVFRDLHGNRWDLLERRHG